MVHELLSRGRGNAKTGASLAKLLGLTLRELTIIIERERRQGVPICAATGANPGYYLAANMLEMEDYCKHLQRRIDEMQETCIACMRAGQELEAE